MKAVLYVAHGSRRETANEECISFLEKVMEKSGAPIQAFGFLEHAVPTVQEAIEVCITNGATEINVVPVFLLSGVHVSQDLPEICANYPEVTFRVAGPLGSDDLMVEVLCDRLRDAGFSNLEDEVVLLVGHGSRNPLAKHEFENLASRLGLDVETAYLTTPDYYDEAVEKLADHKIYLLPHLLFSGGYATKMKKRLADFHGQLVFCREVGFDEKLIPLILKRSGEV